jgi:phosphoglycolate phosphatase-like HAD superfamily hydrolase
MANVIKAVLWDFDGVILDSMRVRDYGFRTIFRDFPTETVESFIRYHRYQGGLSRFHKIRYFFNEMLHQPIDEKTVLVYADRFSEIMKKKLTDPAYLIDQSITYIKKHFDLYHFHIVSGSEEKELNYLCQHLGIARYFQTINGSPTPKTELVRCLMVSYGYDPDEIILIGDSINDFEAAKKNGIRFYGFNNDTLKSCSEYYIENFKELYLQ